MSPVGHHARVRSPLLVCGIAMIVFAVAVAATLATLAHVPLPTAAPLSADCAAHPGPTPSAFTVSLSMFVVPTIAIWLHLFTIPNIGPDRKALVISASIIVAFEIVLDLLFGYSFFDFGNHCAAVLPLKLPSLTWDPQALTWAYLPVEQVLFYLFGGIYMVSLYAWGSLYWLARYQERDELGDPRRVKDIIRFNWGSVLVALALIGFAILYKSRFSASPEGLPGYFIAQVVVGAALPTLLYPTIRRHLNWQAFLGVASFMLLLGVLWEVTLSSPYRWWTYKHDEMVGIFIRGWYDLPIEAALSWLAASWSTIFLYETVRVFLRIHHDSAHASPGQGAA